MLNRDRGIIAEEGLDGQVRYAGQHQAILYYSGIDKAYPDQETVDRFFGAWRGLFLSGEAQTIIESYGLEPAVVE